MASRSALCLLCFASFIGVALGLTVGPVQLMKERRYITYTLNNTANNSVIECVYSLDEWEKVSKVMWKFWEDKQVEGEYVWSVTTGGGATGRLDGAVNLSRQDGMLELTKLSYDLTGDYSCGVELSSGEKKESEPWEVLIVDIIGISSLSSSTPGCDFVASYNSPTMFPGPTLSAGMYSKSHGGYIQEVSSMQWLKVLYPNESMSYSFKNFTYTVDADTPNDVFFEVTMGITKASGEYISLGAISSNISSFSEYGCPDVKEGENKDVHYFPGGSTSCRGGRKPTTRATIACKRGFRPDGDTTTVVLRCEGSSLTWRPEEGHTAVDEDLVCVEDTTTVPGGGGGSPRTAMLSSSLLVASALFNRILGRL